MLKLAIAVLCIFIAAIWFKGTRQKPAAPTVKRIQDLDQALAILRASTLESRAIPNERLVRAFGIENSFTTTLPEINREFVGKAKRLLRTDDDEIWVLRIEAFEKLRKKISKLGRNEFIPLVEMVQAVVFQVVFHKFFEDLPPPAEADAISITRNINIQWIGSKDPNASFNPAQVRSQQALDSALRRVFQLCGDPAVPIAPLSNPLNILLPAYEALWQVVLSGFLHVAIHSPHANVPPWSWQFEAFIDSPSRAAFDDPTDHTPIRHFVAEILRLYPPTKRIKRFHDGQLFDIDVEYLQRDVDIWGRDAEVFEPDRWSKKTEKQDSAYMPFGSGKFVCPSKRVVGPMLIGMLVGVLVTMHGEFFEVVGEDGEPAVLGNEPLESGRNAYEVLRVKRL